MQKLELFINKKAMAYYRKELVEVTEDVMKMYLPQEALDSKNLKPSEKRVLTALIVGLKTYAKAKTSGVLAISNQDLTTMAHISGRDLPTIRQSLEDRGLIKRLTIGQRAERLSSTYVVNIKALRQPIPAPKKVELEDIESLSEKYFSEAPDASETPDGTTNTYTNTYTNSNTNTNTDTNSDIDTKTYIYTIPKTKVEVKTGSYKKIYLDNNIPELNKIKESSNEIELLNNLKLLFDKNLTIDGYFYFKRLLENIINSFDFLDNKKKKEFLQYIELREPQPTDFDEPERIF